MLVTVDLAGFLFLMWKRPKEPPKEDEVDVKEEEVKEVVAAAPVVEQKSVSKVKEVEESKEDIKDNSEEVVIKKIEEVEES